MGVPDKRLGELPTVIVTFKRKEHYARITEEELMEFAAKRLPRFAWPVMVIIQKDLLGEYALIGKGGVLDGRLNLERNPAGKIVKAPLRKLAADVWAERSAKVKSKL